MECFLLFFFSRVILLYEHTRYLIKSPLYLTKSPLYLTFRASRRHGSRLFTPAESRGHFQTFYSVVCVLLRAGMPDAHRLHERIQQPREDSCFFFFFFITKTATDSIPRRQNPRKSSGHRPFSAIMFSVGRVVFGLVFFCLFVSVFINLFLKAFWSEFVCK